MSQKELSDFQSSGVECPVCGRKSDDFQSYAIHFGRSSDHDGNALIELVGQDRLRELHYTKSNEAAADTLGVSESTFSKACAELGVKEKTWKNKLEWQHGVRIERILYHLHHDALMSENEMSTVLGVSRCALTKMFEDSDVHKRTQKEAERVKWEKMDDSEKKNYVDKIQPKEVKEQQRKQDIPDELREWRKNNKDKVREFASRGADAREENGMAGVTGQDNPAWRGGKNVLDAVKKQLPTNWRQRKMEAKDRDEWTCQQCGTTEGKMDSHHIIPVMCGGTHGFWNLMTLCESCHKKAESFIRQYPEFDPVLVE